MCIWAFDHNLTDHRIGLPSHGDFRGDPENIRCLQTFLFYRWRGTHDWWIFTSRCTFHFFNASVVVVLNRLPHSMNFSAHFFFVFLFIPKRSYVGWDWILIITQTTGAPQLLRENITVSAALQVRRLAKRTSMLKSSPLLCAMEPNKINSLRYFFPNRWMKKKKFIQIEYEIFLSCMPSRGVRLEPSDNILSWEKKKPIITNFSIPDRFYSLCSNPSCPFYFSSLFQYMTQSITADEVKLGYIPKKKDICIDLTLCTSIGPFFFLLRYIFL